MKGKKRAATNVNDEVISYHHPLDLIFEEWRQEMSQSLYSRSRDIGTAFEKLCVDFLNNDPQMVAQYSDVQTFAEWAEKNNRSSRDVGIDLVASLSDGSGFVAVQCKFYKEGQSLYMDDVSTFLAKSSTKDFVQRLLIDTTGKDLSQNLQDLMADQEKPVVRVGLEELRQSTIDWEEFYQRGEIEIKPRLGPREHQCQAIDKIAHGLADKGSRGKAIMACGTGKTLTALWAMEELLPQQGQVLVMVPSLALMSQTIREWMQNKNCNIRAFAVCSDAQVGKRLKKGSNDDLEISVTDLAWPAMTDAEKLTEKVLLKDDRNSLTVIFSTYQSSEVIQRAQQEYGLPVFDLAIFDEAHRTASVHDKDKESQFTRIHSDANIVCHRRLYMTATPKVFSSASRGVAKGLDAAIYSMENTEVFGDVLYELSFAESVEAGLLSDYRVIVFTVPTAAGSRLLANGRLSKDYELRLDKMKIKGKRPVLSSEDAALMVGCWRALTKADPSRFPAGEREPMKSAIAFSNTIRDSQRVGAAFDLVGQTYESMIDSTQDNRLQSKLCIADHVDGTFSAEKRGERLQWLKNPSSKDCRILSNARCLAEGVDVPALDAILFMQPRKSQIDVVQAVGRVMRKSQGKKMGYVILPVVLESGEEINANLMNSNNWKKVWQMLNAIRSHDESFDAALQKRALGEDTDRISIIHTADIHLERSRPSRPYTSRQGDEDKLDSKPLKPDDMFANEEKIRQLDEMIRVAIADKCGTRSYWEDWAGDVGRIAQAHIDRIRSLIEQDGPDAQAASELFKELVSELQKKISPTITEDETLEMLGQHMVAKPVFDAVFGKQQFSERNAVSKALESLVEIIQDTGIQDETEGLERFYESVRRRVKEINTPSARQKIIKELYDSFFRKAFPKTTKELGVVYTPIEIVDFILHSVNNVMQKEFKDSNGQGRRLGSKSVHILDPFTGTGTFITRLLELELLTLDEIKHKYDSEIHANELILLAYYVALVNIETVYHRETESQEFQQFKKICLADTFQIDKGDQVPGMLEENSQRIKCQMDENIQVIVGNPPWMAGKKQGYDDDCPLYKRIAKTYVKRSRSNNKNSLYDSYKLALRWSSDRIGDQGVIGFVTNASWLRGNADSGTRACVNEEFTSIYIVDLKGRIAGGGKMRVEMSLM